jgi:hypothetical protein
MRNVFILEDDLNRQEQFRKKLSDPTINIVIVDNVKSAKEEFVKQNTWDYIFLDHDLGGQVLVESTDENTGYQFAKWLAERKISPKTHIFCHSLNPAGSENILGVLPQTIPFPFPMLISVLKLE